MTIILYILATIGGLFVSLILWNSVVSTAILAVKYTNAARKCLIDAKVPKWKFTYMLPHIFAHQFWHLSHGIGSYTVGGQVGDHTWGDA